MLIESKANPKIKFLKSLHDKKARAESRRFIAEGFNVIKDADLSPLEIFVAESAQDKFISYLKAQSAQIFTLKDFVFESISDTETPHGILAVYEISKGLPLTAKTVVVLDGVKDPGNIGAIIRSMVAFGYKDLVLLNSADPYNPKAVRASLGGIFNVNIAVAEEDNIENLLSGYDLVGLDMGGGDISLFEKKGKTAFVIGSEAHGISEGMRKRLSRTVSIPMQGKMQSLNVAVATGIALHLQSK
ncbi:MAG: RNA methyltransferase [Firmicutes bacterium]|nr:RNA methyltransferase [Bacillota bacterium]